VISTQNINRNKSFINHKLQPTQHQRIKLKNNNDNTKKKKRRRREHYVRVKGYCLLFTFLSKKIKVSNHFPSNLHPNISTN